MKRLYRSPEDRMLAGICGGVGDAYAIDPTLLRLGLVFLALATAIAPAVIAYILGWIIIPLGPPPQDQSK